MHLILLTAFFFILINNLMGLIPFFPGGANITGNIAVTFCAGYLYVPGCESMGEQGILERDSMA